MPRSSPDRPTKVRKMEAARSRVTWSSLLVLWAVTNVHAIKRSSYSSTSTIQRRRARRSGVDSDSLPLLRDDGGSVRILPNTNRNHNDGLTRQAFYKFPIPDENNNNRQQQGAVNPGPPPLRDDDDDLMNSLLQESQGSLAPVPPPPPPVPVPTSPPRPPPTGAPIRPATPRPTTVVTTTRPTPKLRTSAPTRLNTIRPTPGVTCTVQVTIDCVTAAEGIPCTDINSRKPISGGDPCKLDVNQTYTVTNKDASAIDILSMERSYNGETTNLIPFLLENPLGGKASTAIVGTTTLDACAAQDVTLGLVVVAKTAGTNPGVAEPCDAKQTYAFSVEPKLDTTAPTDMPTTKPTKPPPTKRPTSKPTAPPEPCLVTASVTCLTSTGRPCAELDSTSCDAATLEPVQLVYVIKNNGDTDSLVVASANATFNEVQADVVPFLPNTTVAPGDSVSTSQTVNVGLCVAKDYQLTFRVEADAEFANGQPSSTSSCVATDTYQFQISGPPPSPALLPKTPKPSAAPVEQRNKPTLSPEELCQLVVNVTCDPPPGIDSCESIPPAPQECIGRPNRITMRYTGGLCNQTSSTAQLSRPDWFSCKDVGKGPPTKEGTASYIVVTARNDPTIVYHRGYVTVGDTYELSDGGNLFVPDQNITIYSSDEVKPDTMLQTLVYHTSCTQSLFMNDQYGASQLIGWKNEPQGVVSSTATFSFVLSVSVGATAASPVSLESLLSTITYGPTTDVTYVQNYNLTDQVAGFDLAPGSTLSATYDATLDITQRGMYGVLSTVTGQGDAGYDCADLNFYSMFVEDQLPPESPTQSPTITPGPTPDPKTAPCLVAADIRCVVLKTNQACQELAPPTSSRCSGGQVPQELRFMYRSGPCSQSNTTSPGFNCTDLSDGTNSSQLAAFIRVSDPDGSTVLLEGTVRRGEIFTVGRSQIPLSSVVQAKIFSSEASTEPYQVLRIPTTCDDTNDVSLLTNYGSLQLTSFENSQQGYQSAIEVIDESFVIRNDGDLVTTVQWANATSTLYGDNVLVSPDPGLIIAPGLEYPFSFESTLINLYVSSGSTYRNGLSVVASNPSSGIVCVASSNMQFTIR